MPVLQGMGGMKFPPAYTDTQQNKQSPPLSRSSSKRKSNKNQDANNTSSSAFLGRDTKSQWLEWSHNRRASYKNRLDRIEQKQKENETRRMSTPVRKARKESVMFVSPELETQHIPEEDEMAIDETLAAAYFGEDTPPKPLGRRRAAADIRMTMNESGKLSDHQWNRLIAYWDHSYIVRSRYMGIMCSLLAFIFGIVSICSETWITFEGEYTQNFVIRYNLD